MNGNSILLIGFYNTKALGVRYLEKSLKMAGYEVCTLFLKEFNSVQPEALDDNELLLLKTVVNITKPALIGLSVMSSLYLETVIAVNEFLHAHFTVPVVWGGVYPTLFPERSLAYADYVLRGEGEEAIIELADAVIQSKSEYSREQLNRSTAIPYQNIRNLAFKTNGSIVQNELRPLNKNLDSLGHPLFTNDNKFFIDQGKLTQGDPMLKSVSYELSASRGCPFVCSYCSSVNLKRIYKNAGGYVRFRGVSGVINELVSARTAMKSLKVIHFWDEIFPDDREWIDDFAQQYKNKISLPFEIWGHPLRTDDYTIARLTGAGLYKVVMGIQSGSPSIRKDIFHRTEKQEDILEAGKVLSRHKVPQIVYDFMLRHPFEKEEDIRQTYELCTRLAKPFELQLHGLSFLPGTDIVGIAIAQGILDRKQAEAVLYGPMQQQYNIYWGQENQNVMMDFWYSLIYLTQFKTGLILSRYLSHFNESSFHRNIALKLPKIYAPAAKFHYLYQKVRLLIKAVLSQSGRSRKSGNVLDIARQ